MRTYQIVSLLIVCSAFAFVAGLKLGERRVQTPSAEQASEADGASCACEWPEGWAEVVASREAETPRIPPVPGKPSIIAFVGEDTDDCRRVMELLSDLQPRFEDEVGVAVIDARAYPEQAVQWQPRMVPTLVFLDAQGRETSRHEGPLPAEELLVALRSTGAKVE